MKWLKALNELKENKRKHWLDNDKSNKNLEIIEKALKVLEVVANKPYSSGDCLKNIMDEEDDLSYEEYKKKFVTNLNEKEYELLKGLIKNE